MPSNAEIDREINQMIVSGQALEAFEKHYADDIVMVENFGEPYEGKDFNRKREEEFFASVEAVHGIELLAEATEGDVSFSEWTYDLTFKEGGRKALRQVAVRRWRDGQVVHERFYYDPS